MILAGTGSRSLAKEAPDVQSKMLDIITALVDEHHPDVVYSGGAEGFDACLARAARDLDIPYELWLPHSTYISHYWGEAGSVTGRNRLITGLAMLRGAADIHVVSEAPYYIKVQNPCTLDMMHPNLVRNHYLLANAQHALVFDGKSHGVRHGVWEIKRHQVPFTELWIPR